MAIKVNGICLPAHIEDGILTIDYGVGKQDMPVPACTFDKKCTDDLLYPFIEPQVKGLFQTEHNLFVIGAKEDFSVYNKETGCIRFSAQADLSFVREIKTASFVSLRNGDGHIPALYRYEPISGTGYVMPNSDPYDYFVFNINENEYVHKALMQVFDLIGGLHEVDIDRRTGVLSVYAKDGTTLAECKVKRIGGFTNYEPTRIL